MKYSQTILKAFKDYLSDNMCGVYFEEKYIKKSFEEPTTEAQAKGHWFEYAVTGATPRNSGVIPEPETTKKGELTADYQRLSEHVERCKALIPAGSEFGKVITAMLDNYELEGIADIFNGSIEDIKTTGLLNDEWREFGWGGDAEKLKHKPAMFQAKFYPLIVYLNTGNIMVFRFLVFDVKTDEYKIIRVQLTKEYLENFKDEVKALIQGIEYNQAIGFEHKPSFKRCKDCPLVCEKRMVIPEEIVINFE